MDCALLGGLVFTRWFLKLLGRLYEMNGRPIPSTDLHDDFRMGNVSLMIARRGGSRLSQVRTKGVYLLAVVFPLDRTSICVLERTRSSCLPTACLE